MNEHHEPQDRRIVVGVDGSAHSKSALRWALTQARLIGAAVEAVSAWQDPALVGYSFGGVPISYEGDSIATITDKVLAETVAEVTDRQEQPVQVRTRVTRGHPAQVLLDAAAGADMLVLGSRGHGTFAGILLGSVSQHCVQHAPCPVLVVPQHAEPSE
ncbi:universal stress protein [Dactylosporangium vinaceum]|uniref:Universal stress protein n=1 Tax=Dactylosporangium vinaceum TaxID=53362 RepID=A0ABV5MKU9_9ACTN|nr:universal stress protein [Dactylosporangium vinaceum]UAB93946.1 universal stress protein [Dactylosporangium vinaceum]